MAENGHKWRGIPPIQIDVPDSGRGAEEGLISETPGHTALGGSTNSNTEDHLNIPGKQFNPISIPKLSLVPSQDSARTTSPAVSSGAFQSLSIMEINRRLSTASSMFSPRSSVHKKSKRPSLIDGDLEVNRLTSFSSAMASFMGTINIFKPSSERFDEKEARKLAKIRTHLKKTKEALNPLLFWRKWLSSKAGASIYREAVMYSVFFLVSLFGTIRSVQCIHWGFASGDTFFGKKTTARNLMFIHYIQAIVTLYYVRKADAGLSLYIERWLQLYAETSITAIPPVRKIKRWAIGLCFYAFGGTLFFALLRVFTSLELGYMDFPDRCPNILFFRDPTSITEGIFMAIATFPNLYAQGIFTLLCVVTASEFKHISDLFQPFAPHQNADAVKELSEFRNHHFKLINLTETVDDLLSYYTCWVYAFNMPGFCLVIYSFMKDKTLEGPEMLSLGFWALQLTCQFCLISITPAFISTNALEPTQRIQDFVNSDPHDLQLLRGVLDPEQQPEKGWLSERMYQEVALFMQQLTGSIIGITCGGFFFLTKEILMTLLSVLITFFAAVMQMDMGTVCSCGCKNDTLLATSTEFSTTVQSVLTQN